MVDTRSRKRNIESQTSINISLNSSKIGEDKQIVENGFNEDDSFKKENECKELHYPKMNWWYEDRSSVLLLFFLYVLQGIPLGLAGSIPMLLAVSIALFVRMLCFFYRQHLLQQLRDFNSGTIATIADICYN